MEQVPKQCLLSLKKYRNKKFEDVESFLLDYFAKQSPATYYKNGLLQCLPHRHRSVYDLYSLAIVDFPDLTIEEFSKVLISIVGRKVQVRRLDGHLEIPRFIMVIFCTDINKVVFYADISIWGFGSRTDKTLYGDYAFIKKDGEDGLSFRMLLNNSGLSYPKFLEMTDKNKLKDCIINE